MLRPLAVAVVGFVLCTTSWASDYEDGWTAIRNKNFTEAKRLLSKATTNSATALDAYLTLAYLNTYQSNEEKIEGFYEALASHSNKNQYLYPLWFNGCMLGGYHKKSAHQLELVNKVMTDNGFNGSILAAAHYGKAMHFVFSHQFDKAHGEWNAMGALDNWQLAGPFENLSGSGFNNANGPIAIADAKAVFKGINNIDVSWFTPSITNREGWMFTYPHLPQNSALIYAQTFVSAPEDMKILLNLGCNGSAKVWVNDVLILSESKERITELDYYKNHCYLKKGYNRILVQLGYTGNSQPNFIVRLTDENMNFIKELTSTSESQAYTKANTAASTHSLKHFAEDFFEKKIESDPTNLINYILLSQTYLRDDRATESRQVIEKALALSPDNPLLKFELIQCLMKLDNRTVLMQEVEWLKENDPESYLNYQIKVNNLIQEEKYTEADEELGKMKALYGEDEVYLASKISILGKQEKVEELLTLINLAYEEYPENTDFLSMMFRLKKQVMKDVPGALNVYEEYLKDNFDYSILTNLADEYKEQGHKEKFLNILREMNGFAGHDPAYVTELSKYYFEEQNYTKSLDYALQALKLAPYTGRYWNNVGDIQEQMGKKADAVASLQKAIYYDRTNYDARKKLNSLLSKPDLYKLIPEIDIYAHIKNIPKNDEYDFSYVLDEKSTIIYDAGASEEYVHYAVKIHTQKGIDYWKEIYLNYDENNQTILVEKCEVVKSNGTKIPAERNGTAVVFTGLEAGDAIHVKYRIQNYFSGRLGAEYWDKFIFSSFSPSALARYILIVPRDFEFKSEVINSKMEPVVKDVDGYRMYTWEITEIAAVKDEPYMPTLSDVGTVLHISTLKTWPEVANWYSDLAYQNWSNNFELNTTYDAIFADQKQLSHLQKARRIYEYILTQMRYSSVSFRQSGFVPQDVSKIITTRLGDCKDFSTLFVALANKAGIPAQMVLIDTRDNGSKDMVLPSMEFNHCIVVTKLDGKDYYLELTDNTLPFGSLPNNLNGALSLLIPPHGQKSTETLKPLVAGTRAQDKINRKVEVNINGKDIKLGITVKRTGHLTSAWREHYATLPEEKKMQEFEQSISGAYKNPLKLESLNWGGLTDLSDSLTMSYTYTVTNEVIEAGSIKLIKIPFGDVIATLDNFSSDNRVFPVEYWNYENTDIYETEINISLPPGHKLIEVPPNQILKFKNNTYSISYSPAGERLKIIRKATMQRENISSADYLAFKKFMKDIVEAESKYIVFKE